MASPTGEPVKPSFPVIPTTVPLSAQPPKQESPTPSQTQQTAADVHGAAAVTAPLSSLIRSGSASNLQGGATSLEMSEMSTSPDAVTVQQQSLQSSAVVGTFVPRMPKRNAFYRFATWCYNVCMDAWDWRKDPDARIKNFTTEERFQHLRILRDSFNDEFFETDGVFRQSAANLKKHKKEFASRNFSKEDLAKIPVHDRAILFKALIEDTQLFTTTIPGSKKGEPNQPDYQAENLFLDLGGDIMQLTDKIQGGLANLDHMPPTHPQYQQIVSGLTAAINKMSPEKRTIFYEMLDVAKHTTDKSELNKMSPLAFAAAIGGSLIAKNENLNRAKQATAALEFILRNRDQFATPIAQASPIS